MWEHGANEAGDSATLVPARDLVCGYPTVEAARVTTHEAAPWLIKSLAFRRDMYGTACGPVPDLAPRPEDPPGPRRTDFAERGRRYLECSHMPRKTRIVRI